MQKGEKCVLNEIYWFIFMISLGYKPIYLVHYSIYLYLIYRKNIFIII